LSGAHPGKATPAKTQPKKKACNFSVAGFFVLVRLAGIEPTTPWFVACSRNLVLKYINGLRTPTLSRKH
jgi:hypothetical protein